MLKRLLQLFSKQPTTPKTNVSVMHEHIDALTKKFFYGRSILTDISESKKQELIGRLHDWIAEIYLSSNPVLKLREHLAIWVCEYADYQVLCLTEEEKKESFAQCPYISGELYKSIQVVSDHKENLKQIKWERGDWTDKELISFCNSKSALALFYTNSLNCVRWELGDIRHDKDWLDSFREAMLIWQEDQYRRAAGMDTFISSIRALQYSTYLNFVANGVSNPRYEWENKYLTQ
jgi:hypothetical protein